MIMFPAVVKYASRRMSLIKDGAIIKGNNINIQTRTSSLPNAACRL